MSVFNYDWMRFNELLTKRQLNIQIHHRVSKRRECKTWFLALSIDYSSKTSTAIYFQKTSSSYEMPEMTVLQIIGIIVAFSSFVLGEDPIAYTVFGQVQGLYGESRCGRQIIKFLGIPYAKPPTGTLRFKVHINLVVINSS